MVIKIPEYFYMQYPYLKLTMENKKACPPEQNRRVNLFPNDDTTNAVKSAM